MLSFQKKIQKDLLEAEHALQSAHRLVNTLYPQLQDSKILLSALQKLHKAAIILISLALKMEHIKKNMRLSRNPKKNMETFFKNSAKRYDLQKQHIYILRHLLILGENLSKSGCTFPQVGRAFILNDDGTLHEVSPATLKNQIFTLQKLLKALKTTLHDPRKI